MTPPGTERFYSEDPELDRRRYDRPYREEVDIILSALDCVLNGEKAVYASSDLTTGRRFYRLLGGSGARDAAELKDKLGEQEYRNRLFGPNSEAANAFARSLRERLDGKALVIAPAPLIAPGWTQPEYLAFFETLIRTRVSAVYLNDGWEYSSGCTLEFAVARVAGVPTFDAAGAPLDTAKGLELIRRAVRELEEASIEPIGLRVHLAVLERASAAQRVTE